MTTSLTTPKQIAWYRLCVMAARIKMELHGIKFRGRATSAIMREELGLPQGTSRLKVLEATQAKKMELFQEIEDGS